MCSKRRMSGEVLCGPDCFYPGTVSAKRDDDVGTDAPVDHVTNGERHDMPTVEARDGGRSSRATRTHGIDRRRGFDTRSSSELMSVDRSQKEPVPGLP